MNGRVIVIVVAALSAGLPVSAQQSEGVLLGEAPRRLAVDPLVVADSLLYAMRPRVAFDLMEARLEANPDDYEARWRAARLAMSLGTVAPGHDERIAWYRVAEFHGMAAVELRPGGIDGLVWAAAAKGRLAIDQGGARTKARLASEVWDLTEQVMAQVPDHAMANGVRGKTHQEIMKLDGFSRFIGRTFIRSAALRGANWDDAERHLLAAIQADPGMVLFYLDLGESYLLQEKWAQAGEIFRRGLAVANRFPPDAHFKRAMQRQVLRADAGGRDS